VLWSLWVATMLEGSRQYSDMEQVVRLMGDLGERYGFEHTYFNLRTPGEAIKLLCVNYPKLQEELVHAHEHGIGYQLVQADFALDYPDLQLPMGSNDLVLTPVVAGSGGSTGKILAGVAIIALSFGIGAIASAGVALGGLAGIGTVGTAFVGVGASLVLGGITQMLSPQPRLPVNGSQFQGVGGGGGSRFAGTTRTDGFQSDIRGSDGAQSYAYTGAANSVGVGATIPVVYGKALVGSHLLSANIEVTDESDPLKVPSKAKDTATATSEVRLGGELLQFDVFTATSGVEAQRTLRYTGPQWGYFPTLKMIKNDTIIIPDNFTLDSTKTGADVVLVLRKGLYDFVAGTGTSVVDGAITYSIEIQDSGSGTPLGSSVATIQGQLREGQQYYWIQRTTFAQPVGVGSVRVQVTIEDFKCRSTCEIQVLSVGYDKGINKYG
jgi:predicted phage tail protein